MKIVHFDSDKGPRANSPTVELEPAFPVFVTQDTGTIVIRYYCESNPDRRYQLLMTREEAKELGERLITELTKVVDRGERKTQLCGDENKN